MVERDEERASWLAMADPALSNFEADFDAEQAKILRISPRLKNEPLLDQVTVLEVQWGMMLEIMKVMSARITALELELTRPDGQIIDAADWAGELRSRLATEQ